MALLMESKIHELDPGFTVEVDTLEENTWYEILGQFADANIYQTWAYDEVRCGRKNISHLVLRKSGEIVAVAQSRIVKVPLIGAGIAYVRWGPLWRRHHAEADPEIFRQAIRALRNEYTFRRGLLLRLYPGLLPDGSSSVSSILAEEGFSPPVKQKIDRTLLLDLRRPLETLRADLKPHWRRSLKTAGKNGLEILEGSGDQLFELFIGIYREMVARKSFAEPNDIQEFRSVQKRLPEPWKMKIMLCKSGGQVCAGLVCSAIGDTAVYLFGATSDAGLKSMGSYLLHWKLIESLQKNGLAAYDLNGIDPVMNPGTYKFKADLCGDSGKDLFFPGRFESCTSVMSYSCIAWGERLNAMRRRLKENSAGRTQPVRAYGPAYPGSCSRPERMNP